MGVSGGWVSDMIEDDDRTATLRLDGLWTVGAALEWQWKEDRVVQVDLNYISIDDGPVTLPEIPGIGEISGVFTQRETIFLRVALGFGGL